MLQTETNPWLFFRAWDDDGTAKTDLVYNTAGIAMSVFKSNAAAAALSLSAASSATDWAAGKFWPVTGNLYKVGVSTATISSFSGQVGAGGTYTGGSLDPLFVTVGTAEAAGGAGVGAAMSAELLVTATGEDWTQIPMPGTGGYNVRVSSPKNILLRTKATKPSTDRSNADFFGMMVPAAAGYVEYQHLTTEGDLWVIGASVTTPDTDVVYSTEEA